MVSDSRVLPVKRWLWNVKEIASTALGFSFTFLGSQYANILSLKMFYFKRFELTFEFFSVFHWIRLSLTCWLWITFKCENLHLHVMKGNWRGNCLPLATNLFPSQFHFVSFQLSLAFLSELCDDKIKISALINDREYLLYRNSSISWWLLLRAVTIFHVKLK